MSIDNVTEPIEIGIDNRDKTKSGTANIKLFNNIHPTLNRTVIPGKHTFTFDATENSRYSNIGIQLKQARNDERSNILYLNPFIISYRKNHMNGKMKMIY